MISPGYEIRPCRISEVRGLCERFHPYASAGGTATYAFGVYEDGQIVAGYLWQPPAPGASRSVCPEAPQGVLALSRMVAVPRDQRRLNHVSKPLRRQMRTLIDRTRWPVLVTYSDEGCGHTGHVYKCSGWERTTKASRAYYVGPDGSRVSSYQNGGRRSDLVRGGTTTIQRWEHWVTPPGSAADYMAASGWERVQIPGKFWRSGNPAYRYERKG